MLVAAWGGDKLDQDDRLGCASLLLVGAALSLLGPAALRRRRRSTASIAPIAFAAFAKVLIYIAAAVAILIAPRFFDAATATTARRISGADPARPRWAWA